MQGTYLNGFVRRATEKQVSNGVNAQTPHGALVSHKSALALEDLLRIVGCGMRRGRARLGNEDTKPGRHEARQRSRALPNLKTDLVL